jgi:hypothetical protein
MLWTIDPWCPHRSTVSYHTKELYYMSNEENRTPTRPSNFKIQILKLLSLHTQCPLIYKNLHVEYFGNAQHHFIVARIEFEYLTQLKRSMLQEGKNKRADKWIRIGYARIRSRMSLFTTFYFEFVYKYEYYRIRIQNGYFEFAFEYLLDL